MAETLSQARFNLAQADKFPTWYEHKSKVDAAMAAQDAWIKKWYALGWEIDEDGWVAPEDWGTWALLLGHPMDDEPQY